MAWQLIYTSSPRGLVAGRSGFCTVARHPEIRERLVAVIERFSALDRSFSQIAGAGAVPPVIATHRIVDLGDATYHVLSMIQDAGLDYTGRTNHIAHHLICEEHELSAAVSPAQILRSFPWLKRWDSAPRYLGAPEKVSLTQIGECIAMPASHWEKLDGHDGAKALLLTEDSALAGCYLVCPPMEEQSLVPLFEESLFLMDPRNVSPSKLWQVRFTTFLQGTDNARDFDWRGCWENSPAHLTAQKGRERVLVLSQAQGWPAPKNSELIAYAQCGIRVPQRHTRPEQLAAAPVVAGIRSYTQPPPASVLFADDQEPLRSGGRRPRNRNAAKYVLIALALLLLLGAAGVALYLKAEGERVKKAEIAKEAENDRLAKIKSDKELQERIQAEDAQKKQTEARDAALNRAIARQTARVEPPESKPVKPTPQPVKPTPPPPPGADWLEQARGKLPQVPTYVVIGDLKKGVDMQPILSAHKLQDKDGRPKLRVGASGKALIALKSATEHAFLDASNITNKSDVLNIQENHDTDRYTLHSGLKPLAQLDAKSILLTRDTDASWEQATIYVSTSTNSFQIAFFDAAHVNKTNAPFRPVRLSSNAIQVDEKNACLHIKAQLLECLRLISSGITNQLIQLYLQSPTLVAVESEPLLKGASLNNKQPLLIDLAGIRHELDKKLKAVREAERVRRQTPPLMPYTNPNQNLDGAGDKLLGKECPPKLISFRNYLSQKAKFDSDDWKSPWQDYVDYLHELYYEGRENRIRELRAELATIKKDEERRDAIKDHIEKLKKRDLSEPFKVFKMDSTKHPDVRNITDSYFTSEWDSLFSEKNEKTKVTIRSVSGPFVNNVTVKSKLELERLEKAFNSLPKKIADLFPVTLNMKIGDFDWPLAEFVDKP